MNRRRLGVLAWLLALLWATGATWSAGPPPLFYGVISDIQRPEYSLLTEFGWAVDQLNAMQPEFILMPGDLTNFGTDGEYGNVMRVARRATRPIYFAVGNHEAPPGPSEYRARFAKYTRQAPWYHARIGGWHLIVLDSARFVDGRLQHDGAVDEEQRTWLRGELAGLKPDEPIILSAHHPFAVRLDGLTNADQVLALFEGRYLAYTVAGHLHFNRHEVDARGVHHFVTGSLSFPVRPQECKLGYRLFSTVGRDLRTAWVETTDPVPLAAWYEAAGPGRLKRPWRVTLPPAPGEGGALAVRVRYAGEGLVLKAGDGTLAELPPARDAVTAMVIVPAAQSAPVLRAARPRLALQPIAAVSVESLTVYRTSARWDEYELRSP